MKNPLSRALPLSVLLLAACETTLPAEEVTPDDRVEQAADEKAEDDPELARKIASVERQLEVARAKVEIARLEQESHAAELESDLRHDESAVEMARASEERFLEADAPLRLESAKLDLQSAKDRAQEAADELAQIEIMYDEQDLDDMTKEFVVSRGRRNAERASARIAIQERELATLEERELPLEAKRLALDVHKADDALAAAVRAGDIAKRSKAIAVQEAKNKVAELEGELAGLRAKAKKP